MQEFRAAIPPINLPEQIVTDARIYILRRYNALHDTRLAYHNYQRTNALAALVKEIGERATQQKHTVELAQLGALFLFSGYLHAPEAPQSFSMQECRTFLQGKNTTEVAISQIVQAMTGVLETQIPATAVAQILHDAFNGLTYGPTFFDTSPLQQLEKHLLEGENTPLDVWLASQLEAMRAVKFYTHYGKMKYEDVVSKNILQLQDVLAKAKRKLPDEWEEGDDLLRKFQGLERKIPTRATQTFFRASYRNHINLSAIADNKANIMISVNTILISVLITFLSYKNIGETQPMILLPVIIFLVTGLASLTFAILSARPKVTMLNKNLPNKANLNRNIIFFGNFVQLPLEEYEQAMDAVLRDGELLYGNMVRDLYYLGKVLDKKYRFLSISYNIFMVGLLATVVLFLWVLFA
ncbi:MAG: Pycsar system effector family protein [Bacteroidota bacterium]